MAGNYQRIFTLNIAYFSNVVERDIQSIADRIWRSYFQRIGYDYDNRSFFDGAYLIESGSYPGNHGGCASPYRAGYPDRGSGV